MLIDVTRDGIKKGHKSVGHVTLFHATANDHPINHQRDDMQSGVDDVGFQRRIERLLLSNKVVFNTNHASFII